MTDISQSPEDRLRFEIILKFLIEGGTNLAVLSENDLVLDHYAQLIEERLRATEQIQVESCVSTNSEQLVQKFNKILYELTVDQALEKDKKHAPRRYLVFRDSILGQEFELQLLARLVNGFPASNIRVILLINSAGSNRAKLDAFGKNLLQWEVETQAADDAVSDLFNLPNKPTWHVPRFGEEEPPSNVPELTAVVDEPITGEQGPADEPVSQQQSTAASQHAQQKVGPRNVKRSARKKPWGVILFILLVSGVAAGFMHQDFVFEEIDQVKRYFLGDTMAETAMPEEPADAMLPAASDAASAASQSASQELLDTPTSEEVPVVPPSPSPSGAAASASDSASNNMDSMPAPMVPEPKSDQAWVNGLSDTSYVVQLGAFDFEEEMRTFKRSSPLYAKARILHAHKKDSSKRYYILVAGPFASKRDAVAFMHSNPLAAKGWLRTVKSLKAQFPRP